MRAIRLQVSIGRPSPVAAEFCSDFSQISCNVYDCPQKEQAGGNRNVL